MPPTGFHGLIGLIGSSNISKEKGNERIAFFFGTVFPDLDIFGSILIFLIGYAQGIPIADLRESVVLFHRSATHSIFLILLLLIGGLILYYSKSKTRENYGKILVYFGIGIGIHVLFDFFYLDGVSIFWPFLAERIYLPLNLPILEQLPDNIQRFYSAIDIAFDGIYWILFARLISNFSLDSHINVNNDNLMKRRRHLKIGGIIVLTTFTIFGLFGLFSDILMMNEFVILIYIPGMFVLLISCFIPILFRDSVRNMQKIPQKWLNRQKT
ncbi:MAG: metal-dependent hydrolase [Candidatus Hodarchaeales archaeon]